MVNISLRILGFVFEQNRVYQLFNNADSHVEVIINQKTIKKQKMTVMKLSFLTGFDAEVPISSPNMCSHDKHSAREGALHTAELIICL